MASLSDIRARLAAADTKKSGTLTQSDGSLYKHWEADEGTTTTIRLVPDKDTSNPFFWREKNIIRLAFSGIKGDASSRQVEVNVPCIEMFGPEYHCPILAEVRPWYKDKSLEEQANKYWKKRSYMMAGFVRSGPLVEDKIPENPIRKFIFSPQIFGIIKASIMDPEMEEMPTDYLRGLDLNIKKTQKGKYADYGTSTWARKETPLTEVEQEAIAQHGLFMLSDFIPKMPSDESLKIMVEMFHASVDGQPYDTERWGAHFRPWGVDAPAAGTAPKVGAPEAWEDDVAAAEAPTKAAPVAPVAPVKAAGGDKAGDILAMIRARQTKTV
jgi:hypothetical protein